MEESYGVVFSSSRFRHLTSIVLCNRYSKESGRFHYAEFYLISLKKFNALLAVAIEIPELAAQVPCPRTLVVVSLVRITIGIVGFDRQYTVNSGIPG